MSVEDSRDRKKQYKEYLRSELEAAAIYSALASRETDPSRSDVFQKLVEAEMRHAARWAEKIGIDPNTLKPSGRILPVLLVNLVAKVFGTNRVVPILLRLEGSEINAYAADPDAQDLVSEERDHSRILQKLSNRRDGLSGFGLTGLFGLRSNLRASVLGVNDGLVSNFCLVMGVSGGTGNPQFVVLAGVAGLLAGAFSMAAGEYVSVRSQRDLYEHEISKERIELQEYPEEEEEELVLIYQAKGLSEEDAGQIAKRVMMDPDVALDTMVREELGLNIANLGSPVGASLSSFFSFGVGAVVPIVPYFLGFPDLAFSLSALFSGIALLVVGAGIGLISGRNVLWGSLRMLLAGGVAAAVTFWVGRVIGVSITTLL